MTAHRLWWLPMPLAWGLTSPMWLYLILNMSEDIQELLSGGRTCRKGRNTTGGSDFDGDDVKMNEFLIQQQMENEEFDWEERILIQERNLERLRRMTFYCFTNECSREYILRYFGEYGGRLRKLQKLFD